MAATCHVRRLLCVSLAALRPHYLTSAHFTWYTPLWAPTTSSDQNLSSGPWSEIEPTESWNLLQLKKGGVEKARGEGEKEKE